MKIEHSTPASTPELGSEEKKSLAVRALMMMPTVIAAFSARCCPRTRSIAKQRVNRLPPESTDPTVSSRLHCGCVTLRRSEVRGEERCGAGRSRRPRHRHVGATRRTLRHLRRAGPRRSGVRATGKSFTVRQAHWMRVADGKIVEHWAVRDDLGMAKQAGWVPPNPISLTRNVLAARKLRKQIRAGRS